MLKSQEPKYDADEHGRLFSRASNQSIPDDEPVMIFRAQDRHAVDMLNHYIGLCNDAEHRQVVRQRVTDFMEFAAKHPERMKEPD